MSGFPIHPRGRAAGLATLLAIIVQTGLPQTKGKPIIVGPKRTVAVKPFDVKLNPTGNPTGFTIGGGFNNNTASGSALAGSIAIPNPVEFGSGLADMMITALTDSRAFSVVEVDDAASNVTPDPNAAADPAHKPQYLMKAVIVEVSCRQRSGGLSIGNIGGGQNQYENKVTMDVRLVDPLTKEVVESVKATGKKTSKDTMFGATKYVGGSTWFPGTKVLDLQFGDFQASPLAEAARLAAEDAVKRLIEKASKRAWEAFVIKVVPEVTGPEMYLDVEGDCGLKVGDRLDLCQLGPELTDPKTGRVVGRARPRVLGQVEVFMTNADRVICRPVNELAAKPEALAEGLIVRLAPKTTN